FIHVPGLIVVAPSSPLEAYGLLKSAIRMEDPVLFIEHKRLYTMRQEMPATALEAAEELGRSGISVEVIDLRTLLPLDMATIAASVSKTHRVLIAHEAVLNGGVGAEIAARIGSELFDELDAPVTRVGCPFVPIPFAPELEHALLPGREHIVRAARDLVGTRG